MGKFENDEVLVVSCEANATRFGILQDQNTTGDFRHYRAYSSANFPNFATVLETYLEEVSLQTAPKTLICSHQGPLLKGKIHSTHLGWETDLEQLKEKFGFHEIFARNDVVASAHSLLNLDASSIVAEEGVTQSINLSVPGRYLVIIAGSGIGLCQLEVTQSGALLFHPAEGGHAAYSPQTALEIELFEQLREDYNYISNEMLMSCAGLETIYKTLKKLRDEPVTAKTYKEIIEASKGKNDAASIEAVNMLMAMLGSFAGDAVLFTGAKKGVYFVGDLPVMIGDRWRLDISRAGLEAKGRMSSFVAGVPIFTLKNAKAPMTGAVQAYLQHEMEIAA